MPCKCTTCIGERPFSEENASHQCNCNDMERCEARGEEVRKFPPRSGWRSFFRDQDPWKMRDGISSIKLLNVFVSLQTSKCESRRGARSERVL